MNTKHIETLIGRYFNGETSLQEEQQLRDFFLQDELPGHLAHLKAIFLISKQELPALQDSFDQDFFHAIKLKTQVSQKRKRQAIWSVIVASAASILLFYSVLTFFHPARIEDTFNDPSLAYEQASQALFFVSGHLSKGMRPAHEAGQKLDKSVEEISRISNLNKGMNHVLKLNEIDKIRNIISFQ